MLMGMGLMCGKAIYGKSRKMAAGNVFILGTTKNNKSPPYWRFFGTIYASIKRQVYCGCLSDALLAPFLVCCSYFSSISAQ